jgi:hypothetical protein
MFHGKPLYVTIAQRKEDRQAQLQLQYAQRVPGLVGHSATIIPSGYPPYYYPTPPGVVSQVPPRPTMMYQPLGLRPGWGANGFAPPTRPGFQPSPVPVVSTICLTAFKAFSHCIFCGILPNVIFQIGDILEDKKDVRKKDNHYGYVIVIIFHTCWACCSFNFLLQIPNNQRQNRGRMNGPMLPQGGAYSFSYIPQSMTSSKESANQQVFFFFT